MTSTTPSPRARASSRMAAALPALPRAPSRASGPPSTTRASGLDDLDDGLAAHAHDGDLREGGSQGAEVGRARRAAQRLGRRLLPSGRKTLSRDACAAALHLHARRIRRGPAVAVRPQVLLLDAEDGARPAGEAHKVVHQPDGVQRRRRRRRSGRVRQLVPPHLKSAVVEHAAVQRAQARVAVEPAVELHVGPPASVRLVHERAAHRPTLRRERLDSVGGRFGGEARDLHEVGASLGPAVQQDNLGVRARRLGSRHVFMHGGRETDVDEVVRAAEAALDDLAYLRTHHGEVLTVVDGRLEPSMHTVQQPASAAPAG
eukprot:CAMPEP_0185342614 /NCGR_PEP_ID=MMETSP1363-20130426/99212_1 /TAXON_ID=38817 /ORGANISM="Gephyrocapsa oceanica, Strain RCC1303" /LENGTH=315 /DNA_ID=CAMNT_0027941841 /DNA_START=322 /DNA_END=1267 /DNA_ORIENTATION=+